MFMRYSNRRILYFTLDIVKVLLTQQFVVGMFYSHHRHGDHRHGDHGDTGAEGVGPVDEEVTSKNNEEDDDDDDTVHKARAWDDWKDGKDHIIFEICHLLYLHTRQEY